jgi:hypothetical protein
LRGDAVDASEQRQQDEEMAQFCFHTGCTLRLIAAFLRPTQLKCN